MIIVSIIKLFNKDSSKMIYKKLYDKFILSFMLLLVVSSIYMFYDLIKKWNKISFEGNIALIILILLMFIFSIVKLIKTFKKINNSRYL